MIIGSVGELWRYPVKSMAGVVPCCWASRSRSDHVNGYDYDTLTAFASDTKLHVAIAR